MNREIKFRAWDKEEKEMIYNAERTYDFTCSGYGAYEPSFYDVLQNTDRYEIMQFTGLEDINSKEIYEGDILNVSKEYSGNFQTIIIVFEDGCFKGQVYHKMNKPFILDVPISTLEIIGNIFENPELLKEKE